MSGINDRNTVQQQYADAGNLSTRISIHDKYSTNKQGFGNWIASNYRIEKDPKVLELGCGTGDMWKDKEKIIADCSKLILSDFSAGMVETAERNIGCRLNVEYKVIDIGDIPYEDGAFDIVIANMMLYHVPDIHKGLSEVRRVLKSGGHFYCATYGENGIMEYLSQLFSKYGVEDGSNKSFTLQNGAGILRKHFSKVEKLEYKDSLAVTNPEDMVDYIYSLSGMTALQCLPKETILKVLSENMTDGVLNVPKEYGMFTAS